MVLLILSGKQHHMSRINIGTADKQDAGTKVALLAQTALNDAEADALPAPPPPPNPPSLPSFPLQGALVIRHDPML